VIEFRVLGSSEVVDEGCPLALGSLQQRLLLAVLLVHRGVPVSSDRLIDELSGEQAPASANKFVQGHISNLRKVRLRRRLAAGTRRSCLALRVPEVVLPDTAHIAWAL
jgi:DNA-binding SARP family transcriptional activator